MTQPSVLFEVQDGYALVTLNRPDKLNSFNPEMHQSLREALATVKSRDDIRAVLLTGAGRAFCAGQDLSDRVMKPGGPAPDLGQTIGTLYNPLVRTLRTLEKPVVCAVNGVAAGAGANVALACDIVVAGRSASFLQAFAKIGLMPDSGGTYFLPRLVGTARAMGLALLADKLPAEEAARIGLIWKCVDDAQLMDEAKRIAAAFGKRICDIVLEVTDDKKLPKAERKHLQIVHAAHASRGAKLVKLADKICHLRDVADRPPAGWDLQRRQEYFEWARQVIDRLRGAHPRLESAFDAAYGRKPLT